MKMFKKGAKKENRKVMVTLLNLFTKEIETAYTYEDALNAILCNGFDILKVDIL